MVTNSSVISLSFVIRCHDQSGDCSAAVQVGFVQTAVLGCLGCLWFNRNEVRHILEASTLLQGQCSNSTHTSATGTICIAADCIRSEVGDHAPGCRCGTGSWWRGACGSTSPTPPPRPCSSSPRYCTCASVRDKCSFFAALPTCAQLTEDTVPLHLMLLVKID